MTKRDQIVAVANATGLTSRQARDAIEAVSAVVRVGLLEEGQARLDGLGTFKVVRRRPRRVTNPATRVPMDLPATAIVKFAPLPALKEQIKEKHA